MLLRFGTSNFTSIRDFQELSLVASSLKENPSAIIENSGFQHGALRVAAIYGPNASGKTNFLFALRYMRNAVRNSQSQWDPTEDIDRHPFALDDSRKRPTEFLIDFVIDSVRYEYGFSVDDKRVLREFLYAYPEKRRQLWFERNIDSPKINFGKNLTGENRSIENLTRPDSLFLSAAAQNNHEKLLPIFKWFSNDIIFRSSLSNNGSPDTTIEMCASSEEMKHAALRLLSNADLGIVGMNITETPPDEELRTFAEKFRKFMATEFADTAPPLPELKNSIRKIELQHRTRENSSIAIPISQESAGTLSYLALIGPALRTLASGGVLFVDELDASLHPILVDEIVRIFNDGGTNKRGAQLIFSTHGTELLSSGLLRRDQIWFTEKDDAGTTRLYPMSDFQPRKHENLQRGYLQGRYGATPFVRASALAEMSYETQ